MIHIASLKPGEKAKKKAAEKKAAAAQTTLAAFDPLVNSQLPLLKPRVNVEPFELEPADSDRTPL